MSTDGLHLLSLCLSQLELSIGVTNGLVLCGCQAFCGKLEPTLASSHRNLGLSGRLSLDEKSTANGSKVETCLVTVLDTQRAHRFGVMSGPVLHQGPTHITIRKPPGLGQI